MSVAAHQETLAEVLSGQKTYRIPEYQRPYVWSYDQAQDLVEDLLAAWDRGDEDFFLGSIVLIKERGSNEAEVVDGQQRLTTIGILFAVLRHLAAETELKNYIQRYLSVDSDPISGTGPSTRVQVRQEDADFYRTYIADSDIVSLREPASSSFATEGQRNMRRSADAIFEALCDLESESRLRGFISYLRSVSIVAVETDNFQEAHRVFGVLNTRGVPLAAADVFKARILADVPVEQRSEYASRWNEALSAVENDPDAFFQQLLLSITKSPAKQGLESAFTQAVIEDLIPRVGATAFIDQYLVPLSDAYVTVEHSLQDDTAEILDLLHDYESKDWRPAAMWVVQNVPDADARDFLLWGVDRVFGLHTLGGSSQNTRRRAMAGLLQQFESHAENTQALLTEDVFAVPDPILYAALASMRSPLPRSARRVVLLRRAHWQAAGPEGLLPPDSNWASVFPKRFDAGADLDLDFWRGRLGSLVLATTAHSRVEKARDWNELRLLTDPGDQAQRSAATLVPWPQPPSNHDLREREDQLVRLVAQFWQLTRDSSGVDPLALSDNEVLELAGSGRVARSRPTTLADVVRVGLLSKGDVLSWHRPRKGETHRAVVTADSRLRLSDGTVVKSPTAAAARVAGTSGHSLRVWKRESDGKSLGTLWELYERRFSPGSAARRTAGGPAPQGGASPTSAKPGEPGGKADQAPAEPAAQPAAPANNAPSQALPAPRRGTVRTAGSAAPGSPDHTPRMPVPVSTNIKQFLAGLGPAGQGLTRLPDRWRWQTRVSQRQLKAEQTELSVGLAQALGLRPGDTRVFRTGRHTVPVSWSEKGPVIGDLRLPLLDSEVFSDDDSFFYFTDKGVLSFRRVADDADSAS